MFPTNGSNFVGAAGELKQFLNSQSSTLTKKSETSILLTGISSLYVHPTKVVYGKQELNLLSIIPKSPKRVLSNALLTYESISTILTQIESILNSRPLTPLSSDPNDLTALSPAHFLIGRSLLWISYRKVIDVPSNGLTYFEQLEKLKQQWQFWTRWSKEYVNELQVRTKWWIFDNIKVGTLVLIKDDNTPSYLWKIGRVVDVHKGADNIVRVVSIKCSTGVKKRAVSKVCALPLN